MSLDEEKWIDELEEALSSSSLNLQSICQDRLIPSNCRGSLWKSLLGIGERKVVLAEFFDLDEQSLIRSECMNLVSSLDNEEAEQLSVAGDMESVITTLSKKSRELYRSDNGWTDILRPLITTKMSPAETFLCLDMITHKFVPRMGCPPFKGAQPFHLMRLLILYHDPELSTFLDSKKITPDKYCAPWFRSLFGALCPLDVTLALWDTYFLMSDPFLLFFLGLVIIVNSRDQILEMREEESEAIIGTISAIPKALEVEDLADLFALVQTHYIPKTPSINFLHNLIFQCPESEACNVDLAHALCLPVQPQDILPNPDSDVKYFVIDCRHPEQYNAGHLSTAFHLDTSLMLQDMGAFDIAVQALLTVQRQAIDANSVAGGDHLCFIGTGKNQEDQYVYMVVAYFLQKNYKTVSLCSGGFNALHELLKRKHQEHFLSDHNPAICVCCLKSDVASKNGRSSSSSSSAFGSIRDGDLFTSSIFDKLSIAVKSKTSEVKGKLVELVTQNPVKDKYRGLSLFDDAADGNYEDISNEVDVEVNVDQWAKEHNALSIFPCREIKEGNPTCTIHDSFLVLTESNLFIIREVTSRRGNGKVVAQRPLEMIVQITSRKKTPDVITFKYGESIEDSGLNIIATDLLSFKKPYDVTRAVKQQVIKVLDRLSNPEGKQQLTKIWVQRYNIRE